ncbi:MAG: TonB-dependent receptor [Acidobacteria bacterium]|nr:TonB-dependent receptor [Acidobacteriota bacterium]
MKGASTVLALVSLAALALPALAADGGELAEPAAGSSARDDLVYEITVKGRTLSPLSELLDMREVRETPARDVGEALRMVAGVDFVRKGAIANDLVLRGLQRDNVTVTVDGARLHGACPNRMDSAQFHVDFAEIERVRVTKGAFDVARPGSVGGSIDIETRPQPAGWHGELNGSFGSYGARGGSVLGTYGGERVAAALGYAVKRGDVPRSGDGTLLTDVYPAGSPSAYREGIGNGRAYEIDTGWAKLHASPAGNVHVTLDVSRQDAGRVLYPYLAMDAVYDDTNRARFSVTATDLGRRVREIEGSAWWSDVDHVMDNGLRLGGAAGPGAVTMRSAAESGMFGGQAVATLAAAGGTLRVGLDHYRRTWDVQNQQYNAMMRTTLAQPMIPDVLLEDSGAFAELRRNAGPKWTLTLAARADRVQAEARALDAERLRALYRPYVDGSPDREVRHTMLGGNVQLAYAPREGLELFAGAARGTRPPDPQELFIGLTRMGTNWIGNPLLDPSASREFDLGFKSFGERFYVKATAYRSDVDDFINVVELPDPDGAGPLKRARGFANIDARLRGAELESHVSLPAGLFARLRLSATRGDSVTDGRPLSEIPPLQGSLALRYEPSRWFVEIEQHATASQDRVDTTLEESPTGAWRSTDLKVGTKFRGLRLVAGIANLFDAQYTTHLSYQRDPFAAGVKIPEPGRSAYLTVGLSR